MGIHLETISHDDLFNQLKSTGEQILLVNDYSTSSMEDMKAVEQHIYSHFKDSEVIADSASCNCKKYTESRLIGHICDECGTPVQDNNERRITPSMWIKAPEGVKSLISPQLWIMLDDATTVKEFSFLDYFTDPSYKVDLERITSKDAYRKVSVLLDRGFKQGLNYFIENFDEILQFLFDNNIIRKRKHEFQRFIAENKHNFFPQHLPLPSKVTMVVEYTTSGTYLDKPILNITDAALCIASIKARAIPLSVNEIQRRTAKAIKLIAHFNETYGKERIAKKRGLLRRHVLGGRLDMTGRSVITSISDPHRIDEIHIPWGMAVQLLKYHIMHYLFVEDRMSVLEAQRFIYSNVLQYNARIDAIIKTLIRKAQGGRGLVCLLARNPTLQRGSTQQFYISTVKTNLADNTISMPHEVLRAPNADFDGDQLNLTLILDNDLAESVKRLAPHLWVWSLDDPHTISKNLEVQGPIVELAANWLNTGRRRA